ncbi:DM13 domain-containing protein [Photobacterium aphoticum]|uniref:Phenylalanine--tRNA ligase n=1 Tax=Photobacterium aphoticum TaxID=754436 RepID=A0A0J1GRG4_9GAMM|nr:DM13 domain-containing protein [Photobacterium aphoticum]KLV02318.1 phenylalanine--tRNA ligase [Photobacterium aphoticum]PSU56298.1 hypothetical protein C9I90_13345 [Photobacterium aphoticum]GHA55551.1 hypothetical protein GCM10007086_32120 [Photobacterium aphoticum]
MLRAFGLLLSHGAALAAGFVLGVYALPILIAPDAPPVSMISATAQDALFTTTFDKNRQDSDFLHWGEGEVTIGNEAITFVGELAPGPDYKLYLSPVYVETEADFNTNKSAMVQLGDIHSFDRFMLPLDSAVDINQYNTVIVWCESFGQYITSAQYR